jgi:nickel-dependent lactate racemase
LIDISRDPLIRINKRFMSAEFRIVTGYIEPHFMAGFSGGRKGVCPALADLATIQRFHGFETLADPRADNGILEGNPCHRIALSVARTVEVDFLFNVSLTQKREIAGVYCGDLETAHLAGCAEVAGWTTATFTDPFDLVITNGGGFPLDLTFYQTVKGMCTALPALHDNSVLLQVSECAEQLGSPAYTELMLQYNNDWRKFLRDIERNKDQTALDQWELQMQCRVLERIGRDNLLFVSDGIPADIQQRICVNPILGTGSARERTQQFIDRYVDRHPDARIAVIPDGPYTMLKRPAEKGR